jgi:endonuclease/exonuclease/phosphatase family metal-dependent hydrolase
LDTKTRYTARDALEHPFIVDSCGSTALPNLLDARKSSIADSIEESMPRPLGDRTALDDSGVVSSLNSLNLTSEEERRKSKGKAPSTAYASNNNISTIRPSLILQAGPKQIKSLSYNIFLRPPGIHNNASDHKNARLNYFGEHVLGNFDVVCLQEMFSYGSSRQTRMVGYAKKVGFEYYVSSPSKGILNAQVDGGLMILSKYPIVKTQKLTYKRGVAIDRFSAKGAIYAKIAVQPRVHIHVFNTHLQSSSSEQVNSLFDPSVAVRLTQLAVLKEFIDECTAGKPSNEPILLLGVMNTNAIKPGRPASESSDEYNVMINLLSGETIHPALNSNQATVSSSGKHNRYKVKDLLKDALKFHPVTYGDVIEGTKKPKETTLTTVDDWGKCNCLDYIFYMNGINDGVDSNITVKENATKVEKFLVDGEPYSQISDHYGVSTNGYEARREQTHRSRICRSPDCTYGSGLRIVRQRGRGSITSVFHVTTVTRVSKKVPTTKLQQRGVPLLLEKDTPSFLYSNRGLALIRL